MENKSYAVVYRNEHGEKIAASVFAETMEEARIDAEECGGEVWVVDSIEPHEETLARILISEFAEKQQGGYFACPRCGRMTMDADSVTRNALSRRIDVYVCDSCGMQESLEDMVDSISPLSSWAIARSPELWRADKC